MCSCSGAVSELNDCIGVRIIVVLSEPARPRARGVEIGYTWLWDGWSLVREPDAPIVRDKLLIYCETPGCAAIYSTLLLTRDSYVLNSSAHICPAGRVLVHASINHLCGIGVYVRASEIAKYLPRLVAQGVVAVLVDRGRGYAVEAALNGVYDESAYKLCVRNCGDPRCDLLCRLYAAAVSNAEKILVPE